MLVNGYIGFQLWTYVYSSVVQHRRHKAFQRAHGCKPGVAYRQYEPLIGLDFVIRMVMAARNHRFLEMFRDVFNEYGSTWATSSMLKGSMIITNEPENLRAVQATNFDDWDTASARLALKPLLGDSVFMSDGPAWSHGRALLRPIFAKERMSDLAQLEEHVQAFLRNIPANGQTFDLQELFFRFTFDTATGIFFGQSSYTLSKETNEELVHAFTKAVDDAIGRSRFGRFYPLIRPKNAHVATETCRKSVNAYVQEALAHVAQQEKQPELDTDRNDGSGEKKKQRYNFLHEFARETNDEKILTDNAILMLSPVVIPQAAPFPSSGSCSLGTRPRGPSL